MLSQIEAAHETIDMQKNPATIRFPLTNLTFVGDELHNISSNTQVSSLPIKIDDVRIRLSYVPDYSECEKILKATKNCTVTSQLDVPYGDISKRIDLVDNLCDLLSFAVGTKINWPYYQILDDDGYVLKSINHNRITSEFGTNVLIDPNNPTDLRHFIESTYFSYVELESKYELKKILDIIVQARLNINFIELRALNICSAIDLLRGKWSNLNRKSETIEKNKFKNKYGKLKKVIAEFATTQLNATDQQIEFMTRKVSELNRPPLNDILKMMILDIGADIPINDIDSFKKNRDKLVHEASFATENDTEDFLTVLNFADCLILSLLGYSGRYFDVRTHTIATINNNNPKHP